MFADEFRPQSLSEVIGNEHIKASLKKYFTHGNLPHTIQLYGQFGAGKSQPVSEPVLTPNGYVPMGSIKVGDEVVGSNGLPTKVTGVFPQGVLPIYEVVFSDGSTTRCSLDHLWTVYNHTDTPGYVVLTLDDIVKQGLFYTYNGEIVKSFSVPLPAPVEFKEKELPLDPYTLGTLLGDWGMSLSAGNIIFSTSDSEMFDHINLPDGDVFVHSAKYDYRVKRTKRDNYPSNIRTILYHLGLYGEHPYDKFIPEEYKHGSVSQRLALLQGLMDTGGYVEDKSGACEFSSDSVALVNDVAYIVRSLGGTARISSRCASSQNRPSKYTSYRVWIKLDLPLFRLERKSSRQVYRTKYPIRKHIISVNYVGEEACQCISVEAADSLYITKDFTLTHNTTIARIIAKELNADVIEHDCGANGEISKIRSIVEQSEYSALFADKKVIILDEVHKLSKEAQNVLLKSTEEPAKDTYFILCTSEPDKLIPALRSRGVSFTVQPVSIDGVREAYRRVMSKAKITLEGKAKDWDKVIDAAEGSLRVVYNLLDKMVAAGVEQEDGTLYVSTDTLNKLLGHVDEDSSSMDESMPLPQAVLKKNLQGALDAIAAAKKEKREPMPTMIGLYNYLKKARMKSNQMMLADMAEILSQPERANNWYSLEYILLKYIPA